MTDRTLSNEELERALRFEGYGTKSAPFWFLGMEEGGGSSDELLVRARTYGSVEDLYSALNKIGREKILQSHVPTWRVISKLVMAMQGVADWQETFSGREYQAHRLGRSDGETFLTELMPLPCKDINDWPYPMLFPTKAEYIVLIRPRRIRWLRAEVSKLKPRFVICYGKGNWHQHQEIFSDVKFRPALNGKICVGERGQSTILMLPFLSYRLVTTALINQVAGMFGQSRNGT